MQHRKRQSCWNGYRLGPRFWPLFDHPCCLFRWIRSLRSSRKVSSQPSASISAPILTSISMILVKLGKPSIFLPIIMFFWGVVTIGMGFVKNYHGLIAFRVIIGCLEAGFAPGVLLILSSWVSLSIFGSKISYLGSSQSCLLLSYYLTQRETMSQPQSTRLLNQSLCFLNFPEVIN